MIYFSLISKRANLQLLFVLLINFCGLDNLEGIRAGVNYGLDHAIYLRIFKR